MTNQQLRQAFTPDEYHMAHRLLAAKVVEMMGRKMEEDDWLSIYCGAKHIVKPQWSNIEMDIIQGSFGVEQKMLKVAPNNIKDVCGTSPMHPSLTRSIRIASLDKPADEVMKSVFRQYALLVEGHRKKLKANVPDQEPDLRIGWLLWQQSLVEFLYFEEVMLVPDPNDYTAEWKEGKDFLEDLSGRKPSKRLWIYEKSSGKKRYSVTTSAGIKIQPYFDVPAPHHPYLYYFRVQGELLPDGKVQIWISATTARELLQAVGEHDLDQAIQRLVQSPTRLRELSAPYREDIQPIILEETTYRQLTEIVREGVSDEHRVRLLIQRYQNEYC